MKFKLQNKLNVPYDIAQIGKNLALFLIAKTN